MTIAILLLSVFLQTLCDHLPGLTERLAFVPARGLAGLPSLITHMFAHGGWGHLIGNFKFGIPFMLYLEHRLGGKRMFDSYVLCGLASALLQGLMQGDGGMIGSSGAIFGMATMACMVYGESLLEHVLAVLMMLCLLIPQIAVLPEAALMGVAVWGHIGGGLLGLVLASRIPFKAPRRP